jgi:alpha-beta hydrolase superfamily lysophospholipase
MATSTTTTATAADRTRIFVRHWAPAVEPWASLLLVHGIAEHSGRYEDVARWLGEAGVEVTAYDQRGFGASGGRRAWLDDWSRNHDDLQERLVASSCTATRWAA